MKRTYIAIDLKSFYASVECVERGLDPLDVNLVVADKSRTEKTICLAVSPSLKSYGISGRARLFEVIQRVGEINEEKRALIKNGAEEKSSVYGSELKKDPSLLLDYIVAPPRMALYMKVSTQIYGIYLRYVAPEDIFAYSIDEVFIDATGYLRVYKATPEELARRIVDDILKTTGITATVGIGTNLYLAKVAMDIVAKHMEPNKDGVRVAGLNEESYRDILWGHTPITDFWRIGSGTARRLAGLGLFTMGDVARYSLNRYQLMRLYKVFGKNTELLIDHAWGYEPTTIADVKRYEPNSTSLSSGQVLKEPTDWEHTRLIVWEMAEALSLDLVEKGLVTDQLVLTIGYDRINVEEGGYSGEVHLDHYGRRVPTHAHGTQRLVRRTSSSKEITGAVMALFDRVTDSALFSRRINIAACGLVSERAAREDNLPVQLDFFSMAENARREKREKRERAIQDAVLGIKHKYGKNAVLRGLNYTEGATAIERNGQIGGHRAG